jgi:hypothetical protein
MSDYFFDNWMTDYQMLEMDWQCISAARTALLGWSDTKVRRVSRYLCRIGPLQRTHKWGMEVVNRLPGLYLARLSRSELLAVNILRLAAKRVNDFGDDADKSLYQKEYTRLVEIQSRQGGEHEALKRVAPNLEKAEKYSKHQSNNAKSPRGIIGDDGEKLSEIIGELALSEGHQEEGAKTLWPYLHSKLDGMHLSPKVDETSNDENKWKLEYDSPHGRKSITLARFKNVVSNFRTEIKKSR